MFLGRFLERAGIGRAEDIPDYFSGVVSFKHKAPGVQQLYEGTAYTRPGSSG